MRINRFATAAYATLILCAMVACNDRGGERGAEGIALDTNYSDSRRNTPDTGGYMLKDSANKMDPEHNGQKTTSENNRQ